MANLITSKETIHNENVIYKFKKEIFVSDLCTSIIKIFAETRYKFYINDALVAVGPCKQTSEIKYYDVIDITEYIRLGENDIRISVLQLSNEPYAHKDALVESLMRGGGMSLCLWGNIGNAEIVSDESWLVAKETGIELFFEKDYPFYNVTALCEKVLRKSELNYQNAVLLREIYSLNESTGNCSEIAVPAQERPIPMMYFDKKEFVGQKNKVYDAGKLTCGYVRFNCSGKGKVRLTYAECMSFIENGEIRKKQRDDENGVVIGDYDIVEVDGTCMFEPFLMRTFRFIKVETDGDIQINSFDYLETGYPVEVSDNYDFGNDADNKLFEISVNTLKRCMHETYMDCPYYEQLQYTMDTHLQMLYTYQLTTDKRLAEKAIDDFAKSYRVGFLTQSRYPTNRSQYIPGFSLIFIMMLYEHSKRFSDKEFIRKYIHIADGIIDWFITRLDGYMVARSNLWDFIDWAEGYEFGQISEKEPIAVYSLMLSYVLEKTYVMYEMLGNTITNYKILSEKVKEDVKERCFDKEKGLYADSPSKKHFAQHTQIWAVLSEMETGENAKEILKKSMKLTCKATSAYMFFLFRALEKADIYEMADEYIDSLRSLIPLGCTTTPEWVGEDVRSECHAWSAVAIYEFTAKVLGVTYENDTICIKPYIEGRRTAKGKVATPDGMVFVEWNITNGIFTVELLLPQNTKAKLVMPDNSEMLAESRKYSTKIN